MPGFETNRISVERDGVAPDGSDVRVLLRIGEVSMAQFSLPPGQTSVPVHHRTVEEIWFVIGGRGHMWRVQDGTSETVRLEPGVCLTVPLGTRFQFRSDVDSDLRVIGVTTPPWPAEDRVEAFEADGAPWPPTVERGPGLGPRQVS